MKNRKLIRTCATLAAVAVAEVLLAAPAVTVDDDYNSSTPGWGVTAFNTIQAGYTATDSGGTLTINAGTYDGTSQVNIQVTKPIRIVGAGTSGSGATRIVANGANEAAFLIGSTGGTLSGITIENIWFDGDASAVTYNTAIFATGRNALPPLLPTPGPLANITIQNCRFSGLDGGIALRNTISGAQVLNNTFENLTNFSAIEAITIATAYPPPFSTTDPGPFTFTNITISGNTITGGTTMPIKVMNFNAAQGQPSSSITNVTVENNTITNVGVPPTPENQLAAIGSRHGVGNLLIRNNTISNVTGMSGIRAADGPASYTGLRIEDNSITQVLGTNDSYPSGSTAPAGIKLQGALSAAGNVRILSNDLFSIARGIDHITTTNGHTALIEQNTFTNTNTSIGVGAGTNTLARYNRFQATLGAHVTPTAQFASLTVTGNIIENPAMYSSAASYTAPAPDFSRNWYPNTFGLDLLDSTPGNGLIDGLSLNLTVSGSAQTVSDTAPVAQYDRDADGVPDAFEIAGFANFKSAYSDADSAPDGYEFFLRTDPNVEESFPGFNASTDTDGDGYADWYEDTVGTDKNVAASRPALGDVVPDATVTLADAVRTLQIVNGTVTGPAWAGAIPNRASVASTGTGVGTLNNALQILRFQNGTRRGLPAIAGIN